MWSFSCPCGFRIIDAEGGDMSTDHKSLSCCNCGGVKCMGCVFREWGHDCEDDCPECCRADPH